MNQVSHVVHLPTLGADALPLAGPGHNRPPGPLSPEEVSAYLTDTLEGLTARRDELAAGVTAFAELHPVIETEQVAAAATENINMIRKAARMAEDRRKEAKEPYLLGGRAVDGWFNALKASLDKTLALIEPAATRYAQRIEAERRAVAVREAEAPAAEAAHPRADEVFDAAIEAAERSEAAEALAAARPAVHSRTVGTYGSVSSLRESWAFEVTDPMQVPREYLIVDLVAIRRAVTKGERDIAGCRIYPATKLVTR